MISRHEFLGTSLGARATLALTPERGPGSRAIKAVLKALVANGGRVVDVPHGGPAGSARLPTSSGFRTRCSGPYRIPLESK